MWYRPIAVVCDNRKSSLVIQIPNKHSIMSIILLYKYLTTTPS